MSHDIRRNRASLVTGLIGLALVAMSGFGIESQAAGPGLINYQGFLRDDVGQPIDGQVSLDFRIFDAGTNGNELWFEEHGAVEVADGLFHVILGSDTALDGAIFDAPDRWLETSVDGTPVLPRRQLLSTPYAMRATVADVALSGGDQDDDWVIDGDDLYRLEGSVGIGTDLPVSNLHVSGGRGSASIVVEADRDNSDDDAHPSLRMTQDGGIVAGEVGFFEANVLELRNVNSNLEDSVSVRIGGGSNNVATNADLEIGGGDDGTHDGSSEALVVRGQGETWVLGVRNSSILDLSDFFIGQDSAPDGTFHIEHDGDVGIGTNDPNSKLAVAGDVAAERYSATQSLGENIDPGVGGVYADNVVYAWAWIRFDGVIMESFGISSVEVEGTGMYRINLVRTVDRSCPTVTVNDGNAPYTGTALAWETHIDVRIWSLSSEPQLSNKNFFLHVLARP